MMECNKEDAMIAKGLAEKKMEKKDFTGARNTALKAQRLYPNLENISQMLMVCDVHCAAENVVCGNEKDWYGILKIDPTADEASIKKQYRKFALVLHPDKNKFAGATDAFKLIGEAQRVLLDHEKRKIYDTKRRAVVGPKAPTSVQRSTFWTICPFCYVRYQYYIEVRNRTMQCQNCHKPFAGHEINGQVPTPGLNRGRPAVPKQNEIHNQGPKVGAQCTFDNSASKERSWRNVGNETKGSDSVRKTGFTSEVGEGSVPNEKGSVPKDNFAKKNINMEGKAKQPKSHVKKNGERKKRVSESSESCSTSSTDFEEDVVVEEQSEPPVGQKFGFYDERYPRRSSSAKRNASHSENLTDTEEVNPSKKAKGGEFSASLDAAKEPETKSSLDPVINLDKDSKIPDAATEPETYEYPDPDFSDFDKDRKEDRFAVGQIWAIYDTLDAMPRFYARITKVLSPGFKMKITWLEPDPDNEDDIKWVGEGLPASCGKFRLGNSENTEDHPMFSHLICWEKGSRRDTFKIYPRKGETWALFKDWDLKWYTDPKGKRNYAFDFVEVLSEYNDDGGVRVACLVKVKGFACLFCRKLEGTDSVLIPPKEIFRFSHQVPSFQMTGGEREDVPEGSFELDPASLPTDLEGVSIPKKVELDDEKMHPNGSGSRSPARAPSNSPEPMTKPGEDAQEPDLDFNCNGSQNHTNDDGADVFEIPDPEFYNFDADKSPEKFQIGQIWALYSDEDGLPKYYGMIKKIDFLPEFTLHLSWFFACSPPKNMIQWLDKKMPVSCGKFKTRKAKLEKYTGVGSFSHRLRAEITDKKDIYAIFPRKGEVWALYKNWNAGMKCADLENCEYDMVEVLEENDLAIAVSLLEGVDGYKSVFKSKMEGESTVTMEIPRTELLRFSHQLPAFQLTEEKGGSLRGCWELDPAALPVLLLCSS
ncbi:hypothetical protein LguiA_001149 [Lonicera macranthoides]